MHRNTLWIHVCQKKKWLHLGNGFYIKRMTQFVGNLVGYFNVKFKLDGDHPVKPWVVLTKKRSKLFNCNDP